ncbi:hypothetical protein FACS18949_09780 [Clostridia bacterium]|nr:hypothetical protein FACS18949_09780 [Clostridia bacterium]
MTILEMTQKVVFDKREEQWEHVHYNIELSLLEIVKRGAALRYRAVAPEIFSGRRAKIFLDR